MFLSAYYSVPFVDKTSSILGSVAAAISNAFANALNISNTEIVDSLKMSVSGDDFRLDIKYNGDPIAEEYHAVRQKKHIEKILGGNLWIEFTES